MDSRCEGLACLKLGATFQAGDRLPPTQTVSSGSAANVHLLAGSPEYRFCFSLLIEEPVRCVAEEVGLEVSQGHVPVDLQPVALVGDVAAVRVLDEHHLEHVGRPRCEPDGRVGAGDRLAGLPDRVPGNRPEIVVDGQVLVQPRMVSVALPGSPPYLLKNPSAMLARKLDSKTARVMSPWISRR